MLSEWPFEKIVATEEELRNVIGTPSKVANQKVVSYLDHHCRSFLALSPFVIISTANNSGSCDASPRGDQPGFVHVIDDHHLVIPERPGNRRGDSLTNIMKNPHIGLLFMIPGLGETLRVNGKACVTTDERLLTEMAVNDNIPSLGIGVKVEECFIHCAKAFIRSSLWKPDLWLNNKDRPSAAQILKDHVKDNTLTENDMSELLKESYEKRLY
ncbi:pyridoxamine 5'-phosphate oxidase family protein [Salipaludibacillus agaradhaerens]|uniref:pyridoxamine 5'-phosphate oxidase family protein n=1 Tax=Salipaludibacillus agaradhaerens TaxID=76935 RepID=UPI0021713902|nr:pyridoxamine 5'-phosphate oxidase family protein [Salipaludibacillus agaradhaerens]MCR6107765.1 pyridoxamine 5'-phosphate oxidase family protein [Salipaludibacillus agaradhaerens]MCR6119794.1 pyridoxamine 5'-phosphate oxidase family protein [Salipaludibacillus agaradhaerens]UJW59815.1 pyridoxamine 5'-phosphate oxidase family protein [Bacillus sp. A116_S68]